MARRKQDVEEVIVGYFVSAPVEATESMLKTITAIVKNRQPVKETPRKERKAVVRRVEQETP